MHSSRPFLFLCTALLSLSIQAWAQPFSQLELRDLYVIADGFRFDETVVGGLSGLDYDKAKDVYYIICDDRSALHPARYYTAQIKLVGTRIDTVIFQSKIDLQDKDGKGYPSAKVNRSGTIDPEGLRLNAKTGEVIWVSEGERIVNATDTILVDPAIIISKNGKTTGQLPLAPEARVSSGKHGARQNGTFEALTFSDSYKTLWVALEEPLYQDGPRADVRDSLAPIRIYKYDFSRKALISSFAYDLDPVAHPPVLSTAFRVNGITDILEVGDRNLLVVERSFSTGRLPCTVKLFLTDLSHATDVSSLDALANAKSIKLATKKLVLNMDDLGIHVDNVEGVTWGPRLPNGHRTLLLVTDNNFQSFQKTQVFLFEVID